MTEMIRREDIPKTMPRVLMIEPQGAGGIWHYAHALSRALTEIGWKVTLATVFPAEEVENDPRIPIVSMGTQLPPRSAPLPRYFAGRLTKHVDKLWRLWHLIGKVNPGVVHLHGPIGTFDFAYFGLLRRLGIPIVYTAHDPKPLTGTQTWLDRVRYREMDAILVHSSNAVRELIADGVQASKVTCLPFANFLYFCKGPTFPQEHAKQLLGIPSTARSILFFGMITPYKGLDLLIEAFARLSKTDPHVYLTIAGKPLEDFTPYRRRISELNLAERVILDLRYIAFAEMSKYFLAADVVVLPYRRIHQSGVLQLAYGFARPVVVTSAGGLGEVVAEDRTGIVAAAADPESIASALRRLLSDRGAAEDMGKRARHLAETKYSWERTAQEVSELYRTLRASSGIKAKRLWGILPSIGNER